MAASGTLIADFVSQNSVSLIIAVVTTILLLALSTYFITRGSTSSSQNRAQISKEENKRQTTDADRSSASESDEAELTLTELTDRDPGQSGGSRRLEEVDPVMYCEHIQGEIKRVKQEVATRKIRENLTPEQINQERIKQQEQLAEIFRLMQEQNERFGIGSMDEMKEQMKLSGYPYNEMLTRYLVGVMKLRLT